MPQAEDDYIAHDALSDDPGWFDRFYLNVHSPQSGLTLSLGMGMYPQTDVVDGFAMVVEGDKQRNLRVSRQGKPEHGKIAAGPLSGEVVEPLERWRALLADNDRGFSFDLTFHGDLAPIDAGRMHRRSKRTGQLLDFSHFVQVGKIEGRLEIDGKRHELSPDAWFGLRDRSWGVRPGAGHVALDEPPSPTAGKHDWLLTRIGDRAAFYILGGGGGRPPVFLAAGLAGPNGIEKVLSVERTLDWADDGRFLGSRSILESESGEKIEIRGAPRSTLYLRGGLYGGLDGKKQGQARGDVVEGEDWRLGDRKLLSTVTGLNDHVCRFDSSTGSGYGIYEVASGI